MEHKFPGASRDSSAFALTGDELPAASEEYAALDAHRLHDSYQVIRSKVYSLVGFLDRDREYVRRAGAEATVLEAQMLLESPRMKHAKDALMEAALGQTGVRLANDSMDRIHRLERLVSEAEARLFAARFVPAHHGSILLGDAYPVPVPPASSTDSSTTLLLFVIGGAVAFGLGLAAAVLLFNSRKT